MTDYGKPVFDPDRLRKWMEECKKLPPPPPTVFNVAPRCACGLPCVMVRDNLMTFGDYWISSWACENNHLSMWHIHPSRYVMLGFERWKADEIDELREVTR